ncbi:MAG TPA: bifunctional helix-turn-helix transcriptional regulator/GNAT family N-acetyltransferase [Longimicrobium sp.]|nr:bifunctional helix-turn-helix transcriptional regulator/GNAT family N-acetyltransferase [Longimicrobium sp.]
MADVDLEAQVQAVRRFNRFYTQQIGILGDGHLQSPFSLTEVRVLWELAHREKPTATELGRALGLDAGYLSRILRHFEGRGLLRRQPSEADARQNLLWLTPEGQEQFAALNARAGDEIRALLARLAADERQRLVRAMQAVERLLGGAPAAKEPYLLRTHQPGDMGWVVHRHGVLYFQEYGWDERFEALVAEIVAKFIRDFDPRRERCWIAEKEGEIVGSVFLAKASDEVAQLRLLLVEPSARGLGIGRRLVDECIRFARAARYRRMKLWTNSVLHAARRIYEEAGFQLVHEEPHQMFSAEPLVSETWEMEL